MHFLPWTSLIWWNMHSYVKAILPHWFMGLRAVHSTHHAYGWPLIESTLVHVDEKLNCTFIEPFVGRFHWQRDTTFVECSENNNNNNDETDNYLLRQWIVSIDWINKKIKTMCFSCLIDSTGWAAHRCSISFALLQLKRLQPQADRRAFVFCLPRSELYLPGYRLRRFVFACSRAPAATMTTRAAVRVNDL